MNRVSEHRGLGVSGKRRNGVSGNAPRHPDTPTPRHGFFARVYELVRRVPRGRVVTYGQVARLLGAPRGARLVGWAMHGNPHGARVPCHRVLQQGGSLSPNYCLDDPHRQRRLLEREGIHFTLDGRVDMTLHQWQPQTVSGSRFKVRG